MKKTSFSAFLFAMCFTCFFSSCSKEKAVEKPSLPATAVLDSLVLDQSENVTSQHLYDDDGGYIIEPKPYLGSRPDAPLSTLHTWQNKTVYLFTMEQLTEDGNLYLLNFNKKGSTFDGAPQNSLLNYGGTYKLTKTGSGYVLAQVPDDSSQKSGMAFYFH